MEQRSNTLQAVIDDLDKREALGRKKYGTDVDRTDFTHEQWLQHAYEEALDMALYLKRAMETTVKAATPEMMDVYEKLPVIDVNGIPKEALEEINKLPDGFRESMIEQFDLNCYGNPKFLQNNIIGCFNNWLETKEGYDFWSAVWDHITLGVSLPPYDEMLKLYPKK